MVEKNPCDRVVTDAELESEMVRLSAAVDAFASEMKAKLLEKAREGRRHRSECCQLRHDALVHAPP